MKFISTLSALLCTIILLSSCASPQKSFSKGNYEKAYRLALKNIKKGKKSRKDISVLNNAFNEIVKEKSNTIDKYIASNVIEDWEEAYTEYSELIDIYYDGRQYLDKDYDVIMRKREADASDLKDDLAIHFREMGDDRLDDYFATSNKLLAQEAHRFYSKTQYYNPSYEDIDELLITSFENAVVHVFVEAESIWEHSLNWEIDSKFSNLERQSGGYYQVSYESNQALADCFLDIEFSGVDDTRAERRNTERYSQQVEDGYETRQDTSGNTIQVPKYITVTGEVTTVREIFNYRWRVRVQADGPNAYCDFNSRSFDAEREVIVESYETSGDSRAIPGTYTNDSFDWRDEENILEEMLDELYNEIESYYF